MHYKYLGSALIQLVVLPSSQSYMDWDNCEIEYEESSKKPKNDEAQTRRNGIKNLPPEIMVYILSKLPLTSLVKFKCVCRAWRILAQDRHLENFNNQCLIFHSNSPIKNHLSFADFDSVYTNEETVVKKVHMPFCSPMVPELNIIGSCNGLLCFSHGSLNNGLYICNPFTGQYRDLPETNQYPKQYVVLGFGFHHRTKEYKVIKIMYYWPDVQKVYCFSLKSDVQIFTLGTSLWRSLGQTSHFLHQWPGTPVTINGRLHWESRHRKYSPSRNIVSFDLEDEKFRVVNKPDSLVLRTWDYLVVLRNCLAVVCHRNYKEIEIWVMKEYDVQESWIKEFKIGSYIPKVLKEKEDYGSIKISKMILCSRERYERVLGILRNGEILLEYKGSTLVLYDPQSGNFKDLIFKGISGRFHTVVHLGNLNLIDALVSH